MFEIFARGRPGRLLQDLRTQYSVCGYYFETSIVAVVVLITSIVS